MGDWKLAQLDEYISIKGGFSYKGKFIGEGDSILLGMGCVSFKEKFLESGARLYSGEFPTTHLVNPGDIVLATRQQSDNQPILGSPAIIPEKYLGKSIIVGTNLYRVINESELDNRYMFWLLKTPDYRNHIFLCSSGTTVRMITKDAVESYEFLCPSSEDERKAISDFLWQIENKIDLLRRQNKTLEAMAETLFRQWFVEEAQEDWEPVKVGDFVKTNTTSINKDYEYSKIKYLDTGSLTEGKIDGYQLLDIDEAPSRARRIVKHNDILISTVRPNQKHYGILKHPDKNLIVSTGFCVITCEKINPHFIYLLLTTNVMTEFLHSIAEGSTSAYPSLKPSDIEMVEFQLPPDQILEAFADYADSAWDRIDSNYRQIHTLEKLRDTLLPKLMSGEVRVDYNEN